MIWSAKFHITLGDFSVNVSLAGDHRPTLIIGPNGAGKSTVLRVIAGAHRVQAGRLAIGGRVIFDTTTASYVPPESRRIGYLPQGYGLFPHLDVLDNVAFGLHGAKKSRLERRRAAQRILEAHGARHLVDRQLRGLSGGERQRVALARAMLVEPELLLFDEPLSALDVLAKKAVRTQLSDYLRSSKTPAIVVTHDVRDVRILDGNIIVLEDGKVVQEGTREQLEAQPASEFVSAFFESG